MEFFFAMMIYFFNKKKNLLLLSSSSPDTLKHMTTPKDMKTNVMKELDYLDINLPKGSHVILMSLADGRFLWDTLHNRYHPLGNKYLTYCFLILTL